MIGAAYACTAVSYVCVRKGAAPVLVNAKLVFILTESTRHVCSSVSCFSRYAVTNYAAALSRREVPDPWHPFPPLVGVSKLR